MGRRGYPPECRRMVLCLDLVQSGRSVADVDGELGTSSRTIYTRHRQDRIDEGLDPG